MPARSWGIIVGLLESGLWLWMAWKTRAGRNWARITSTVFFGLFSVPFVLGLFKLPAVPSGVVIVEWAVGLAALILLWQRESSQFFARAYGLHRGDTVNDFPVAKDFLRSSVKKFTGPEKFT
jgi:hypothetical protein